MLHPVCARKDQPLIVRQTGNGLIQCLVMVYWRLEPDSRGLDDPRTQPFKPRRKL